MTELRKASQMVKVNLVLRLILEMAMLASFAAAPAIALHGWSRWALAAIAPIGAMAVWGVFATPNDPSRSGRTVVPTPGPVRLFLEFGLFAGGAALLVWAGLWQVAAALAVGTIVHYLAWPKRIRWMMKN